MDYRYFPFRCDDGKGAVEYAIARYDPARNTLEAMYEKVNVDPHYPQDWFQKHPGENWDFMRLTFSKAHKLVNEWNRQAENSNRR